MNEQNYKMRLAKNNIEIEVVGDKDFVEKKFENLIKEFFNIDDYKPKAGGKMEKDVAINPSGSIIEFIGEKNPKPKATELMPVLVYYAKHFQGLKQFNEDDVKNLYRRYDISKRPKNIYQAIVDIVRNQGYFENVPKEKGYFKLTEAGEHLVEVRLVKK